MESHKVGNGRAKTFSLKTTKAWPHVRAFERHVEGTKEDHNEWWTEVPVQVEYAHDGVTVEFTQAPARGQVTVVLV